MHVYCLANNKGGVCKTTSTVNLAYGLARAGRRVLVVDCDAQSNSTYALTGRLDHPQTLFNVLIESGRLTDCIISTKQEHLSLVPGSINLSAADLLLAAVHGRELKLKRALRDVQGYDYILFDTPPNLGVLTVNAFIACTDVLIPVALTTFSLVGLGILEDTMQQLRDGLDVQLPVMGVLGTLDDHTRISADVLAAVREHFGPLVFNSIIPRNIKVEEAHNLTVCLFDYAPASTGAKAYAALVDEVIQRAEG